MHTTPFAKHWSFQLSALTQTGPFETESDSWAPPHVRDQWFRSSRNSFIACFKRSSGGQEGLRTCPWSRRNCGSSLSFPLAVHILCSTSASRTGTGEFELEILRRLFHIQTLMEFIPLGFFFYKLILANTSSNLVSIIPSTREHSHLQDVVLPDVAKTLQSRWVILNQDKMNI